MRTLITGGAGFIGSHACDAFLASGHAIRVLDDLSTGMVENLAHIENDIEFVEGDLRDLQRVETAAADCDVVVHLGALGSVPRSFADPLSTHEVNATGTLNVLTAARDADVGRVIFASSSSVFGSNRELPKREDMTGEPLSPYAATKRIGEDYCRQFGDFFGLDVVRLRFFNVFGPRQRADHVYAAVIPKFIDAAMRNVPVEIHGDGTQSRDFTYVQNAVDGLTLLADLSNQKVRGEVVHLACGHSVSLLTILDELDRLLGTPIDRTHTDPRPGDIKDSLADISKISALVGYKPAYTVAEGLAETVAWFKTGAL